MSGGLPDTGRCNGLTVNCRPSGIRLRALLVSAWCTEMIATNTEAKMPGVAEHEEEWVVAVLFTMPVLVPVAVTSPDDVT